MGFGTKSAKASPKPDAAKEMDQGMEAEGVVSSGESYLVSVWSGSDGKFGAAVKVFTEPRTGETIESAAKRANAFAVLKLREVEDSLAKA